MIHSIEIEMPIIQSPKQYIYFHKRAYPKELDRKNFARFLSHLTIQEKVSFSTQNSHREITFVSHGVNPLTNKKKS